MSNSRYLLLLLIGVSQLSSKETNFELEYINNTYGQKLYDYIQAIGFKVFGGGVTIDARDGLNNLLMINPKIPTNLTDEKMTSWSNFINGFGEWFTSQTKSKLSFVNRMDSKLRYQYSVNVEALQLVTKNMSYYARNLNSKDITKELYREINGITDIFLFSLNKLPQATWTKKSRVDIVKKYKVAVNNNNFDLSDFFANYKTLKKQYASEANKDKLDETTLNNQNIYHILEKLTLLPPIDNKTTTILNQQERATFLINMLEELVYHSRSTLNPFSTKLLNPEQVIIAQEIINALYSLFPASETLSVTAKIIGSNNNERKLPLCLFAQARVLLITLRAYLRKVEANK